MNILVNLPAGFYETPPLRDIFDRLNRLGTVRKRSHESTDAIAEDLRWSNAVLLWSWPELTPDLLDQCQGLKFIGHLDVQQKAAEAELSRSIPVSVSRHGFSPAVSEMALGLILGTLRNISDYHQAMRTGVERWTKDFPRQIEPLERELTGQAVGLIGFGRVGRRLAELLRPFRCELFVHDPFAGEEAVRAAGARSVPLLELVRQSLVVVLCAASNAGTRHLIGEAELALFRDDSVLVNVARAALVDTEALVKRLQRGRFFAAIDVFDREPLEQDSVLRTLPNAYLTPHRAGGVIASARRILEYLVEDLEAVSAGGKRSHALTREMIPSLDA